MSGCNCKTDKNSDGITKIGKQSFVNYFLKGIIFLLMIAALPIINLVIIWFMFNTLIMNKQLDIKPLLLAIGNKFKESNDFDDDDDDDELTEDDVVMLDVDNLRNTIIKN